MKTRTAVLEILAGCAALLLILAPSAGESRGTRFAMMIATAQVRPSASLALLSTAPDFTVTALDLSRGYVDIPAAALLKMNFGGLRPDVVFEFSPDETSFKSVEVRADDLKTVGDATSLSYRLVFGDRLLPARYAVPVVMLINL